MSYLAMKMLKNYILFVANKINFQNEKKKIYNNILSITFQESKS